MMTLAQAQAIALAVMENEYRNELNSHKHGSVWSYELAEAMAILRRNRQTAIETRKIIAKRLIRETDYSFREIARQSKLSHPTVSKIWKEISK